MPIAIPIPCIASKPGRRGTLRYDVLVDRSGREGLRFYAGRCKELRTPGISDLLRHIPDDQTLAAEVAASGGPVASGPAQGQRFSDPGAG